VLLVLQPLLRLLPLLLLEQLLRLQQPWGVGLCEMAAGGGSRKERQSVLTLWLLCSKISTFG
jgi:hypothetical protein